VLVNNAGYGSYGAIEDVPLNEARKQLDVNVFGLARLTQLVLPHMRAQRSGTIINISSMGGKLVTPLGGWYHASKYAVEALSDALRIETSPFGIHTVVVEPGSICTEWGTIAADALRETSSATGAYSAPAEAVATTMFLRWLLPDRSFDRIIRTAKKEAESCPFSLGPSPSSPEGASASAARLRSRSRAAGPP
jgi:short-subunit dehydrogenase